MLGRFLSPDPIGIAGGINLYAYAGNDPLNLVDRVGLGAGPSAPNGYGGTWSWQWGSHGHGGGWGPGGGSGDDGNGPGGPGGPGGSGDGLGADSTGGNFPGSDIGPNNQGGQSGFAMAAAEAGPETPGEAGIAPACGCGPTAPPGGVAGQGAVTWNQKIAGFLLSGASSIVVENILALSFPVAGPYIAAAVGVAMGELVSQMQNAAAQQAAGPPPPCAPAP